MPTDEAAQKAGAQRARRARAARQGNVQQVAEEMKQAIPGLSPEIAASIGAPLDPTAGFNFAPGAGRPAELPEVGSAPGGAADRTQGRDIFSGRMMGDMMGQEVPGLVDDHDALVGEGIGSDSPPPSPPVQPQKPTPKTHPGEVKVEHPVLTSLKLDLGIEHVKAHDVSIGGHKWTLATLAPADLARASRIADLTDTMTERQLTYQSAIAAHAIVAIDEVPVYLVFGIEVPPGLTVTDHLRPQKSIRYFAAARVYDFINDDTRTQLPQRLYDAYQDKCDEQGGVASYLDDADSLRVRFKCPEEGCSHELYIVPRMQPGTGDVRLPFCQWDGVPMEIVGAEADTESPLP